MSSLTQTSKRFKKGLKLFFLAALVYYTSILFIIPRSQHLIKMIFPDKDPPTIAFGKMPQLQFEAKEITGNEPTIALNTKSGRLPTDLATKMRVFAFVPPEFSYFARQNAEDAANFLGFSESELTTDLKASAYRWRSLQSGGILEINIDNNNLTLDTDLFGKASQYRAGTITMSRAQEVATKLFLGVKRLDDKRYVTGEKTVHLGKFLGNTLLETNTERDAQIAKVDFFRNLGEHKVLGPDPQVGLLQAWVGNPARISNPYNYPYVKAYYHEVDTTSNATYPVLDVNTAWKAVKGGQGVIANISAKEANPFEEYKPARVDSIRIDNIYLAYYETPTAQKYLQPIYVFEGNFSSRGTQGGQITIYLPAVSGDYVE